MTWTETYFIDYIDSTIMLNDSWPNDYEEIPFEDLGTIGYCQSDTSFFITVAEDMDVDGLKIRLISDTVPLPMGNVTYSPSLKEGVLLYQGELLLPSQKMEIESQSVGGFDLAIPTTKIQLTIVGEKDQEIRDYLEIRIEAI